MFKSYITKLTKCPNGTIDFKTTLNTVTPIDMPKASISFTQEAYLKIMLYVRDTNTEIAWHGSVTRKDNNFTVHDVYLYPQIVTGGTVNTDQTEYNKWVEELDDDTFNKMRLQGHSHVNFGASPSGTDKDYYSSILNVLNKNDFYIFMIINKSGSMYFEIYDLENNVIYENQDVNVNVLTDANTDLLKLIDLDKEYYCARPAPTYSTTHNIHDYGYSSNHNYNTSPYYQSSEIDQIFEELDAKYKNPTLAAPKKKKEKKKKDESK
jgi:hypothetical protein